MPDLVPNPVWENEDIPVLIATSNLIDHRGTVRIADIAAGTDLDEETAFRSVKRLVAGGKLEADAGRTKYHQRSREALLVTAVTAAGREATGQWPSSAAMQAELLAALIAAIENTSDEDKSVVAGFLRRHGITLLAQAVGRIL